MKKVYIETNGCAVLRHDTYRIAKYIEENGFIETNKPSIADYIIYSGCAVIDCNEKYAIESIKKLYKNKKDSAKLIVFGCISTIALEKISLISNEIIQIRNSEIDELDNFFGLKKKISDVFFNINPKMHHSKGDPQIEKNIEEIKDEVFVKAIDKLSSSKNGFNQFSYSTRGKHLWLESDLFEIKVASGCTGKCSYCATKLAIGEFKSIPEEKILKQVQEAKKLGYKRIMLMGDEIGAWHENGKNISDLINDIISIDSNFKIGIRYIHPDIIVRYYEKLKPALEKGNIYYFCSAFQSGSERILELMNRNPNLESYIRCMEDIEKNKYPVFKHTQIIVGFPTETEYDVLKTIMALERASFDHVTISAYSKRKGTKAYEMDELPSEIINERMELYNGWLELNRYSKIYKTVRDEFNNQLNRGKE